MALLSNHLKIALGVVGATVVFSRYTTSGLTQQAATEASSHAAPTHAATGAVVRDWEQDGALAVKKVSVEVKRASLADLLFQLQEQTDVRLSSSDAPRLTTVRVTTRVKSMPLAAMMSALARMYGVTWAKTAPNAYKMQDLTLDELQLKLLQTGDHRWYRLHTRLASNYQRGQEQRAKLATEIYREVGASAVQPRTGILVSQLPEELQIPVRYLAQEHAARELLKIHRHMHQNLTQELYLHLGILPRNTSIPGIGGDFVTGRPSLTLRTARGDLVAALWPGFAHSLEKPLSRSQEN